MATARNVQCDCGKWFATVHDMGQHTATSRRHAQERAQSPIDHNVRSIVQETFQHPHDHNHTRMPLNPSDSQSNALHQERIGLPVIEGVSITSAAFRRSQIYTC